MIQFVSEAEKQNKTKQKTMHHFKGIRKGLFPVKLQESLTFCSIQDFNWLQEAYRLYTEQSALLSMLM